MASEAFTNVGMRCVDVQIGMKLRAFAALNAVIWPQYLRAIGHVYHRHHLSILMGGGEGGVAIGVPILGEDDCLKFTHQGIYAWNNRITFGNSECAAGTKIILNINND